MARAIIVLSDDPDGMVQMNVTFEGGFAKDSHAHGQAELVIKHLDATAATKADVRPVVAEA